MKKNLTLTIEDQSEHNKDIKVYTEDKLIVKNQEIEKNYIGKSLMSFYGSCLLLSCRVGQLMKEEF